MTALAPPEVPVSEQEKNSPVGRHRAYQLRDDTKFCKLHPQIHPDNVEDIRLKKGMIQHRKPNGDLISSEKFVYCPRCYVKISSKVTYEK